MTSFSLYPLRFKPIYKRVLWGGTLLSDIFHREIPEGALPVGESWEFSDRSEDASVVASGCYAGKTLSDLVREHHEAILGKNHPADRFPLLVKWIDAAQPLSLQVHPDTDACAVLGEGAEPKTEVWYIRAMSPESEIIAGMKRPLPASEFRAQIQSEAIRDVLEIFKPQRGDAFFIASGLIHAIGAHTLIFEVQQNSNTTYRVSDWGRVDAQGKPRQLHVDQALTSVRPELKCVYTPAAFVPERILSAPNDFFELTEHTIEQRCIFNTQNRATIVTALDVDLTVSLSDGSTVLHMGESALIPACAEEFRVSVNCTGSFLRTRVL